jgi:hypothetical protein|tara:strand:+ start:231 stop:683 length:453 start_codon:yes stop_codon:yes gene_type:complete
MNKTFRGQLKALGQETIRLSTNNGLSGYRITRLQIIPIQPGAVDGEHIVQVYTKAHDDTSLYDNIDFRDPTLLGIAFYKTDVSEVNADTNTVIFDNMTFNQDIFISAAELVGSLPINYIIELEQVKLSRDEATVATLKDMRAGPDTNFGP